MESKEELLNDFLNCFPESTHPSDTERFVKYAVQCAKEQCPIDDEAMRASGKMSEERIHDLLIAYDWIRDAYDYIISTI